jgi:hypothetical protein
VEPLQRPTAEQCLWHIWVVKAEARALERTVKARGAGWAPCQAWPRARLLRSLGPLLAPPGPAAE